MDQKPFIKQELTMQSTKHILIVEDEKFISELYVRALEQAGYMTTITNNGDDALAKALSGEFDIILLDIVIPGMLGIDVLKQLKNKPEITSKIIIATNLEQDETTRTEVEDLADGYIIKAEITPKELAAYISEV
jgi:DNA-binding response OmpR family regulator